MTAAEADRLALLVQARWPVPEFTSVDLVVWRRDLAALPYPLGEAAVARLVRSGREYQPRSPLVLAAAAEVLAEGAERRPPGELGPQARAAEAALRRAAEPPPGWRPQHGTSGPLGGLVAQALAKCRRQLGAGA